MMSATQPSQFADRGRPADIQRHSYGYSSMRESRRVSPHMSPDRVTRCTSQEEPVAVRIPQPYRTSFSAVTQLHKPLDRKPPMSPPRAHNPPSTFRRTPARVTMPARLTSRARGRRESPSPPISPPLSPPLNPRLSRATQEALRFDPIKLHPVDNSEVTRATSEDRLPSNRSSNVTTLSRSEDSILGCYIGRQENIIVRDFMISPTPGVSHHPCKPCQTSPIEGETKMKKYIEKEYVHVHDISDYDFIKRNIGSDLNSPENEERMMIFSNSGEAVAKSEPLSLAESPEAPRERSSTMPSEAHITKQLTSTPVKKSLSSSITNFFRKMSPKSLRKHSKRSSRSKLNDENNSSTNSLGGDSTDASVSSDGLKKTKGKSPKGSPIAFLRNKKLQKENINGIDSPPQSASLNESPSNHLSSESIRILRSIEDNAQAKTEKSVYQAFKDKQSPGRVNVNEGVVLKSQALRAVEFTEQPLQKQTSIDSTASSDFPDTASSHSKPDSPSSVDRFKSSKVSPVRKGHDPPRSLNVREVAKLSKGTWQFPSMSYESIGPCSIDTYTTVRSSDTPCSEPSLVGRNGQKSSSVNASKRTLNSQVSQENVSPIQQPTESLPDAELSPVIQNPPQSFNSPSDLSYQSCSNTTLPLDGSLNSTTGSQSTIDSSPKTPSYLKLSCAVSGYNKYSSYGLPKGAAKIKIIKNKEPTGSVSSECSNSISDNDCIDGGDKSRLLDNEVISKSKITKRVEVDGDHSEALSNGYAETNGANVVETNGAHGITNGRTDAMHTSSANVDLSTSINGVDTTDLQLQLGDLVNDDDELMKTPERILKQNTGSPSTPAKDGHYYMGVVARETERINARLRQAESDLESDIGEEPSGRLRAAIGKATLLTSKKFKQFLGLCEKNINQGADEQFPTTPQDLAGFWDMVLLQVDNIHTMFDEIDTMRTNGWKVQKSPVRTGQQALMRSVSKVKSPRSKDSTPKSTKAQEQARQREEFRRKLIAAKKAGRKRVESLSDKEGIEIFVAE